MAPRISVLFVLDRKCISVKGVFFETPLTEDITSKEFFLFQRRLRYGVFKTMAAHTVWKGRAEIHRRICEENENGSIDQLVVVVVYF